MKSTHTGAQAGSRSTQTTSKTGSNDVVLTRRCRRTSSSRLEDLARIPRAAGSRAPPARPPASAAAVTAARRRHLLLWGKRGVLRLLLPRRCLGRHLCRRGLLHCRRLLIASSAAGAGDVCRSLLHRWLGHCTAASAGSSGSPAACSTTGSLTGVSRQAAHLPRSPRRPE